MNKNTRVSMALIIILIITMLIMPGCSERDRYDAMIRSVKGEFMTQVLSEYDAFENAMVSIGRDTTFELYISEGETVDEDTEKELLSCVEEFVTDREFFGSELAEIRTGMDVNLIRVIFVEYGKHHEDQSTGGIMDTRRATINSVYIQSAPEWNEWLCIYPDATQPIEQ